MTQRGWETHRVSKIRGSDPYPGLRGAGIMGLMVILVAASLASLAVPAITNSTTPASHPLLTSRPSRTVPLLPPRGALAAPAGTNPDPFYMQEGFTLVQENNSPSDVLSYVFGYFTLKSSPYATGYELNGLTNTGDWFQAALADNWPVAFCPSGFFFLYDVWNSVGTSVAENCVTGTTFSAGDLIGLELYLNYPASGDIYFVASDYTTGGSVSYYQAQPDPTATYFQNLGSSANANGYFTGPMTEIVDTSATSCLVYGGMPTVVYTLASGYVVTQYIPWSDEFNPSTSPETICYSNAGPITTLGNSPVTEFYEATGGSAYGPHWEGAQNWSAATGAIDLTNFETDTLPLYLSISLSRYSADVGQRVTVTATITGGFSPFSCEWFANGALVSGVTACTWTYRPSVAGPLNLSGYVIDGYSNYALGWANMIVYSDPAVTTPVGSPTSIDLGQTVTITSVASGGSGGYAFAWSGLPNGCVSVDSTTLSCTPTAAGAASITVTATDSNGFSMTSGALIYTVETDPTVGGISASRGTIDVGQSVTFSAIASGGSGSYTYAWSGLPSGCVSSGTASDLCAPTGAGTFTVTVTVTDSNGWTVTGTALSYVVDGTVTATLSSSAASLDVGQGTTFYANATGGSGGYTYAWTNLPTGCSSANSIKLLCAPTGAGTFVVNVTITDSNGGTWSNTLELTVYADPTISSFGPSPGNLLVGSGTTFTVSANGGKTPLIYSYSGLPPGCSSANIASFSCTPSASGTFTVTVTVTDANGFRVQASANLTVSPTVIGLPAAEGYAVIGGGIAAVVVVAIVVSLVLLSRRKRRFPSAPFQPQPPTPPGAS